MLVACGLNQEQVALIIGKSLDTLARNAKSRAALDNGRGHVIGLVGSGLIQRAIAGDNMAAIFYLKTRAGWAEKSPDAPPNELIVRWAE